MNVSLTPEMENLVQQKIASGYYQSPADVVNAGLRLLQSYDEQKLEALRRDLMAAYEQSQRGESSPLDIEAIIAEGRERWEKRQKETKDNINGSSR